MLSKLIAVLGRQEEELVRLARCYWVTHDRRGGRKEKGWFSHW